MNAKRMTGQDYRREWHLISQAEKSLIAHINQRLFDLGSIHPNAVIRKYGDTEIKAICLTKQYVNILTPIQKIEIIEAIEKWSAESQHIQQLEIK